MLRGNMLFLHLVSFILHYYFSVDFFKMLLLDNRNKNIRALLSCLPKLIWNKKIYTDILLLFCSALGIPSLCKTYAPYLKG